MWRQREGRLSAATEEHLQPGALRMHCCRHGTWRVLKTEADTDREGEKRWILASWRGVVDAEPRNDTWMRG
jgi:hypothetical protein